MRDVASNRKAKLFETSPIESDFLRKCFFWRQIASKPITRRVCAVLSLKLNRKVVCTLRNVRCSSVRAVDVLTNDLHAMANATLIILYLLRSATLRNGDEMKSDIVFVRRSTRRSGATTLRPASIVWRQNLRVSSDINYDCGHAQRRPRGQRLMMDSVHSLHSLHENYVIFCVSKTNVVIDNFQKFHIRNFERDANYRN